MAPMDSWALQHSFILHVLGNIAMISSSIYYLASDMPLLSTSKCWRCQTPSAFQKNWYTPEVSHGTPKTGGFGRCFSCSKESCSGSILNFRGVLLGIVRCFSTQLDMANTPPKINIEPENDGLEDDCPFPGGPYSQVPAINLPGCTS